jgi:ribose 5-phosphate isomerase B
MDRAQLEKIVREITIAVLEVVGRGSGASPDSHEAGDRNHAPRCELTHHFKGRLLSEEQLLTIGGDGAKKVSLNPGTIVTPLARDRARSLGLELIESRETDSATCNPAAEATVGQPVVLLLQCSQSEQQGILSQVAAAGYVSRLEIPRAKTSGALFESAVRCAHLVTEGTCARAVIVDENVFALSRRIGRIEEARPAVCWDVDSALDSRKVAGANVLLLTNRLLGIQMVKRIVRAWLTH